MFNCAREEEDDEPIVPRPPTRSWPKRRNGRDRVTMFGVTLRMTITSEGFAGTSLEVIIAVVCLFFGKCSIEYHEKASRSDARGMTQCTLWWSRSLSVR